MVGKIDRYGPLGPRPLAGPSISVWTEGQCDFFAVRPGGRVNGGFPPLPNRRQAAGQLIPLQKHNGLGSEVFKLREDRSSQGIVVQAQTVEPNHWPSSGGRDRSTDSPRGPGILVLGCRAANSGAGAGRAPEGIAEGQQFLFVAGLAEGGGEGQGGRTGQAVHLA